MILIYSIKGAVQDNEPWEIYCKVAFNVRMQLYNYFMHLWLQLWFTHTMLSIVTRKGINRSTIFISSSHLGINISEYASNLQ